MLANWWNSEGRWMSKREARAILLSLAKVWHPDKWAQNSAQADHATAQRIAESEASALAADIVALLAIVR